MPRIQERGRLVEEALREIADKAALLRFVTAVRLGDELPDASVLSGLSDVCSEIEELARGVMRSVSADALMAAIRPDAGQLEERPASRR